MLIVVSKNCYDPYLLPQLRFYNCITLTCNANRRCVNGGLESEDQTTRKWSCTLTKSLHQCMLKDTTDRAYQKSLQLYQCRRMGTYVAEISFYDVVLLCWAQETKPCMTFIFLNNTLTHGHMLLSIRTVRTAGTIGSLFKLQRQIKMKNAKHELLQCCATYKNCLKTPICLILYTEVSSVLTIFILSILQSWSGET